MKKSGASQDQSASDLISTRIAEMNILADPDRLNRLDFSAIER